MPADMPELVISDPPIAWVIKLTPCITLLQLLIHNLLVMNLTSVPDGASTSTETISSNEFTMMMMSDKELLEAYLLLTGEEAFSSCTNSA